MKKMQVGLRYVTEWAGNSGKKLRALLRRKEDFERQGREQLLLSDDELVATALQVLEHPWMGGRKGAANLVHAGKVWLGPGSYDAIKHTMASLAGQELATRRCGQRPPVPFEMPHATGLNQVWGSDLLELVVWRGQRFDVCVFLDVFNQEALEVDATRHAADSVFVAACFEAACQARGGRPPTVCTKTDRGPQYQKTFSEALEGRTEHVRIPPGTPWFNGEAERGNRDLRAVLYKQLSQMKRPAKGRELQAVKRACRAARKVLNEEISRPSLGNVTPAEVAEGRTEEVMRENELFIQSQRETRKGRSPGGEPWRERLGGLLCVEHWSGSQLLRFLRLMHHDYGFMTR